MPNSDSPTQPKRKPTSRPSVSATSDIHGGRRAAMSRRRCQYSLRVCPESFSSMRTMASRSLGSTGRTAMSVRLIGFLPSRCGGSPTLEEALKPQKRSAERRHELGTLWDVHGHAQLLIERHHHALLLGDAADEHYRPVEPDPFEQRQGAVGERIVDAAQDVLHRHALGHAVDD